MSNLLYPPIDPFASDYIAASDTHRVFFEQCGHPTGEPVLFIHGGPGGGIHSDYRRFFNPHHYRIILVDQRGCGQSTPHASLKNNTTDALIADFECIRKHLDIKQWQLFGGSWGSTLALAYAQAHPAVVSTMVLRGVFLGTRQESAWIFEKGGASELFPDYFEDFLSPIAKENHHNLINAYYDALCSQDASIQLQAAQAWARWEFSISRLKVDKKAVDAICKNEFSLAFSRIECHYLKHDCFLAPNQLLNNMNKINHIPAIIVQGRYDVICPVNSAWALKKAWPKAQLRIIDDAGHSMAEPGISHALKEATDFFISSSKSPTRDLP